LLPRTNTASLTDANRRGRACGAHMHCLAPASCLQVFVLTDSPVVLFIRTQQSVPSLSWGGAEGRGSRFICQICVSAVLS